MTIKNIFQLICGICVIGSMVSCNDYLDTTNEKAVPAYSALKNLSDLQATTANLYTEPWYFFHKERFLQLGDARANNLYSSATAINGWNAQAALMEKNENSAIANAWGSLYNVITQAAYIIDDYAPYCVRNGICTQAQANVCIGEARFMRALAYWFLTVYWHDVPIVDNATTTSSVAYANRFEDVLQYAICEAEFARKWLPVAPYQTGRVSRVSANALLSRLYLTAAAWAKGGHYTTDFQQRMLDKYYASDYDYQASLNLADFYYSKAAHAARTAISEAPQGDYGLMDDYEQIFRTQNNNCRESLFALQFLSGNASTGMNNELSGTLAYDYCVVNHYGKAWSLRVGYDFLYVASKRGGLSRTRANAFLSGMTYDYLFHEWTDCTEHVHHYGDVWTVADNIKILGIKKQVVGGPKATDNRAFNGNSGFDTPMLRMSEVYLNLTEALMGLHDVTETSSSSILEGVNTVRRRAYKQEIAAGTYPGDYGINGKFNLDSLLQERRMEFYMEGLAWSDIVRRSFMGEIHLQRMLDYNNNKIIDVEGDSIMGCHRLYEYAYKPAATTNQVGTVTLTTSNGDYKVKQASRECVHQLGANSYCHSNNVGEADNLWSMIYPPSESQQDPNLLKAPVGYDFTTIINHQANYHE